MKAIELEKAYDPKSFEDRIYEAWMSKGLFQPAGENGKKPFVIVIPPPNVTGVLHMGHGLNNSLQDILIRYHRMLGDPTLWVPGTDHAGIATQNVVERKLRAKGIDRRDLGREKFVEETWKVANAHHDIIKKQLEKIGSSCDWSRERFTFDEGLSKAVRDVFVTLYERGLIYKGKYLVNWCTSCGTALSDDEVEHSDESGAMHHILYEIEGTLPPANSQGVVFKGGKAYIEIATTRPETLLGDTAVAANPEDARYAALVGRRLDLPLTGRLIPLIADAYVDKAFGTGLVKITPAHDPNDFEVGKRHDLEQINILNPDGSLSDAVPEKYRGMKVKDARTAVIADLKGLGLYVAEKPITHSVGHCYRCHTVVEPYLSEQWFVKMRPMADKALAAWRAGEIRFYPQRWENTYENWLTNVRDWCISRQLWWGHRIPVWYCAHCGKFVVAREEPLECPYCKSTELKQDEDVLDTWFSSWLWPFSTLGWPKDTADLRKYYPTSTLVTGFDIIFFWVSRMIMAGLEFTGQVPFRDICMTTLVRDKQGRKMSKSLGNGIDPLEIVDMYGADALKFTMAFLYTSTQDILIDKDDFKLGSKFSNKVWNASRYILMNLEGRELVDVGAPGDPTRPELRDVDRWIYGRLGAASGAIREALATYRFNDAAGAAYEYFWNDFCDWYVEATKLSLRGDDSREKDRAVSVLIAVLEESLALLHPFLSFVTEEIYQKLPGRKAGHGRKDGDMLIVRPYPEPTPPDPALDASFEALRELVRLTRSLKSEFGIAPEVKVRLVLRFEPLFAGASFLRENGALVGLFINGPAPEELAPGVARPAGTVALVGRGFEAYAFVKESVDGAKLLDKLRKNLGKDEEFVKRAVAKLGNAGFTSSAPAEVVAKEREKLEEAERRAGKYRQYLEELA
jgi:valyl-tRNA synthetase